MMDDALTHLEPAYPSPHGVILEMENEESPHVPRSLGRLLSVLVHCMQASRILEIGTGDGYATLWMALALPQAGKIWTIDPDVELTPRAEAYFRRAGVADRIEVLSQSPHELLPIFPQHNLDMIFVHENAAEYAAYLEDCIPLLKLSGLIIFHGAAFREESEFARTFLHQRALDATIVAVGGGTGIAARKR